MTIEEKIKSVNDEQAKILELLQKNKAERIALRKRQKAAYAKKRRLGDKQFLMLAKKFDINFENELDLCLAVGYLNGIRNRISMYKGLKPIPNKDTQDNINALLLQGFQTCQENGIPIEMPKLIE